MKWGEYLYILICILLYFPIKHFAKKTNILTLFVLLFIMIGSMYVILFSAIISEFYYMKPFSVLVLFSFIIFTIYLIYIICKDTFNRKTIKFICNNIKNIFYPMQIGIPFLETCEKYYNLFFASTIIKRPDNYFVHKYANTIKCNSEFSKPFNFTYAIIAIILLSDNSDYMYDYDVVRYCLFHIDDSNLRVYKNICQLFDKFHSNQSDMKYMRGYEEVEKVYLREYIMFFARDEKGKIGQIVYERVLQNFPPEYAETINYVRDELKKIQTENKK